MSTKANSDQLQLDPAMGIGAVGDVPIVGGTSRALVNVGLRTTSADPGNVGQGRQWFRTDLDAPSYGANTGIVRVGGIIAASAAAQTVANTTTPTNVGPTPAFPANSLIVGKIIRWHYWGTYAGAVATNLTFDVLVGGMTITFGAQSVAVGSGKTWYVKGWAMVRTAGVAGTATLVGQPDKFMESAVVTGSINSSTGLNTTVSNTFSIRVTWSVANAGNTLTFNGGYVEVLN